MGVWMSSLEKKNLLVENLNQKLINNLIKNGKKKSKFDGDFYWDLY